MTYFYRNRYILTPWQNKSVFDKKRKWPHGGAIINTFLVNSANV